MSCLQIRKVDTTDSSEFVKQTRGETKMNGKFAGHLEDIIVDEIALEGLEGITLEGLWIRLAEALTVEPPLRRRICEQIWSFVIRVPRIFQFFILPKPRPCLKVTKRSALSNVDAADDKEDCPSQSYKHNQIDDGDIRGSCGFYIERTEIAHADIKDKTLDEVDNEWRNTFIIVAVQHVREQALILDTHNPSLPSELKTQTYCFLERIGRSRYYGEATIGKHSLLNICNDSVIIFYIRNRLSSLNLIKKQHYYEKSQTGSLLQLTRFTVIQRPIQFILLGEAIEYLKSRNGLAEHFKLREHLERHDFMVQKFLKTNLVRKYITPQSVLYREVYPNATKDQYLRKGQKSQEKHLKVLKLIDMNVQVDDIYEEEEADDEETVKAFLSQDNQFVDVSLTEQMFEKIKLHGAEGISQTALATFLGCRKLCIRRLVKKMQAVGLIGYYLKDEGRQRLRMFVTQKHLQPNAEKMNDVKSFEAKNEITKEEVSPGRTMPAEESPTTPAAEPVKYLELLEKTEPDFKMSVKETLDEGVTCKKNPKNLMTKKQQLRRTTVLELTRKNHVVDTIQLVRAIVESEQNLGYTDTICRKSISRILIPLVDEKLIRVYDVQMNWREYSKSTKLVCRTPIDLQHETLMDELLKLKEAFFNSISMKRRKMIFEKAASGTRRSRQKSMLAQMKPKKNDRVGAAKYIRAKLVHELLFHVAYGLKRNQKPLSFLEVANAWKEFDMSIDVSEMSAELPDIYSSDVNWTMFLTPLPDYGEYPEGWVRISDFLLRIPLSIYAKMNRVDSNANALLLEYLKHPIRRYYTIRSLPLELSDFIHIDKNYVRALEDNFKLLGYMGLVQYGARSHKEVINNFVYVNRNALILDTTPSEPGYARISEDREYAELQFHFSAYADVADFWQSMQNICMATKLGYLNKRPSSEKNERFTMKPLPEVGVEEALSKDTGYIVGNGLGAAGLDWTLFAHKSRNWDLAYTLNTKPAEVSKLRPKMRYAAIKTAQMGVRQIFFKRYKKQVVMKRVKKVVYDDVDKECIQRMEQLRVRWDEAEDRMLLICRVANNFMQGNTGQKATTASICRDILQWHLHSMQKSSRSCQRRILYLMRNKANVNQVNSWLNELYQSEYINRTYGAMFYVELKKLYPSVESFTHVARIYFVQLVSAVLQLVNKATLRQSEIIPDTLQQFSLLYRKSFDTSTMIRHFDPKTCNEVNESTINLLIHSSVCSQRDKMLYNVQLFEIYRSYDEGMIEKCFRKVRIVDQLVVTGKMISKQRFPLLGKKVCISSVYRQQFYLLIPYTIYEQCHESLSGVLESFFRSDQMSTISYTCVNSGTSILIMELTLIAGTRFDIQIPKQVLKFDPMQMQNSAHTADKIIGHFRNLVDKSPQAEYTKEIPKENMVLQARKIQFNINVSVHKIVYNTYDTISRLYDARIHFFCALQHLGNTITLEGLADKPFHCPFRCVLEDADYLATISNLLDDNASLIIQLFGENKVPTSLDLNTTEVATSFKLDHTNILEISNVIYSMIAQLSAENQKKELGNSIHRRPVNMVQIAYDALRADEMDGYVSDEEELLAERGENNQRYQDFLVVNTPVLSVEFDPGDSKMVSYKEMQVAESLLPSLDKKQYVLDKAVEDALWKYVDNSTEDLEKQMDLENFSVAEKIKTKNTLDYVEASEIGVSVAELLNKFSDESVLLKSLNILRKLYLIKRVGVGSIMYVHKMKVRPWIIHSFHVKRLEREAMTPQGEMNFDALKRKRETDIQEEPNCKKTKQSMNPSTSRERRNLKPVSRYNCNTAASKDSSTSTEKVKVHMRPNPWIRVNGSLNRRVFDKWIGTILLECTIRCSIPVKNLFIRFHQLHPVNILFLLECLRDLECIEMKRCISKPTSVFTEDDQVDVSDANELTNPEHMFVIVCPRALLKLSLFIGDKKYQIDF